MNQFPKVSLGEVASVIMGQSPKGETYNHERIGLPLLNGPTEFGASHPNCTQYTTDSKRECEAGDLLFCVRGSTTGRMNWADRIYSLGRGVCSIRGETELDTKFLKYCLDQNLDALLAVAGGGTFPNLTKDDIISFLVSYPPCRYKIAAILSAYDDLIENNARRIAILEEMAQLLYREWFARFRFPGHEDVEMVESELGPIPKGWGVERLEEVCVLTMGQSPKSVFYNEDGEGLPFHQGVTDFGAWFPRTRIYCTQIKRLAEDGDILFSVRAPVGRINVADRRIVIGRGLSAIRSKAGNQIFILFQLKEKFQEEDSMGGGTIFKAVTKADMQGILLMIPSQELIAEFEQTADMILQQIKNLMYRNAILRTTRDLLLPRLISGEVDVAQLEIAA